MGLLTALEKGSLIQEDFAAGKIVSLWDMLQFHAQNFITLCQSLTKLSQRKDLETIRPAFTEEPFSEVTLIVTGTELRAKRRDKVSRLWYATPQRLFGGGEGYGETGTAIEQGCKG